MKELIVIQENKEKQIAYIEDGILKEFYKENQDQKRLEGNIYIGKVENVFNGMSAAFVNIGQEKKAFLHVRDLIPKKSNLTGNKQENLGKYKISDYIKPNQTILVQVKKDSTTIKGPRVSSNIQIAGKYVILLPENDFVTVSQKIEDEKEKLRLINIAKEIKASSKIGVIIRTSAQQKDKNLIKKDFENTIKKLQEVQKNFERFKEEGKPKILKKDDTILEKILLDLSDSLDKIYVNTVNLKETIENILNKIDNKKSTEIQLNQNELKDKYDLVKQIEKMGNRKIWLKCGGFITIDRTEALTAIDVNSGKYTGKENLEETIVKVNKEASKEIAKQLRLRDIGGIIVIDYIDMIKEKSKEEVIDMLKESVKQDRAKIQIMEFTKLNLLELTRKHMFSGE